MIDMTSTIVARSDQLNADDLIGGPRTIKITGVKIVKEDQPVSISYEGDNSRPWKPCLSMRRVLVQLWGKDASTYAGKSVTLYRDQRVRFGNDEVGGIRISHASGIDKPVRLMLTTKRGRREPYPVQPLKPAPVPPSDQSAEGAAASVVDAAALMDGIDRCETVDELNSMWRSRKSDFSQLPDASQQMVMSSFKRRKGELTEAAA
jgi:hypothetical protein